MGEAIDAHSAAATLYARRGDLPQSAFNKLVMAAMLADCGEAMAARNLLDEALPVVQVSPWTIVLTRSISANVSRAEGDLDNAMALAMESLALTRKHNYVRLEAHMRDLMAEIALESGHPGDASTNIVLALILYARVGNMQYLISAIARLGRVLLLRGDCASTAYGVFNWGLEWSRKAGMMGVQAGCLAGLAELQQTAGQPNRAAWEDALRMCEETSQTRLANKCRYWLLVD